MVHYDEFYPEVAAQCEVLVRHKTAMDRTSVQFNEELLHSPGQTQTPFRVFPHLFADNPLRAGMNPNRLASVISATVGWNQTRKEIAYYGSQRRKIAGGDSDQRQPTLHTMWDSQPSVSATAPPPKLSPEQQSRVQFLNPRDIKGFGSFPSDAFLRTLSFMLYELRAKFMFLWREQNIAAQVPRPPTCTFYAPSRADEVGLSILFDRSSRSTTA